MYAKNARMDDLKAKIRVFLKDTRMTREELAERCAVKKGMIDKWLSTVPIPADKQRLLDNLIDNHYAKVYRETDIHIRVSNERYRLIQIEAERRGLTTEEWLDATLHLHTAMPYRGQ